MHGHHHTLGDPLGGGVRRRLGGRRDAHHRAKAQGGFDGQFFAPAQHQQLDLAVGLVGVDAKSGKFLWRYDKTAQGSPANIPTPVADDAYVYSGAGRSGGGLIKLKAKDDGFEVEQIYFTPKLPTSIGGAVKVGDYLYGTTGSGLVCAEFTTGNIKWQEKSVGAASLCYADGNLYLHGENGEVALVEAKSDAYKEKGRFTPPESPDRGHSKAWAYPVVANGRLYIRDLTSLWCYDIKGQRELAAGH